MNTIRDLFAKKSMFGIRYIYIAKKLEWYVTHQSFPTHRTSICLSCEQHLEDSAGRAHGDNLARKGEKVGQNEYKLS